jgi:hypothetical protein
MAKKIEKIALKLCLLQMWREGAKKKSADVAAFD